MQQQTTNEQTPVNNPKTTRLPYIAFWLALATLILVVARLKIFGMLWLYESHQKWSLPVILAAVSYLLFAVSSIIGLIALYRTRGHRASKTDKHIARRAAFLNIALAGIFFLEININVLALLAQIRPAN